MPSAALPASRLFERRAAPLAGDSERNASVGHCCGLATNAVGDLVSASASQLQLRTRKETELYEICFFSLQKLPRTYSKVRGVRRFRHRTLAVRYFLSLPHSPLLPLDVQDVLVEKIKRIGGFTIYNVFLLSEFEHLTRLVNEIRSNLQVRVPIEHCLSLSLSCVQYGYSSE